MPESSLSPFLLPSCHSTSNSHVSTPPFRCLLYFYWHQLTKHFASSSISEKGSRIKRHPTLRCLSYPQCLRPPNHWQPGTCTLELSYSPLSWDPPTCITSMWLLGKNFTCISDAIPPQYINRDPTFPVPIWTFHLTPRTSSPAVTQEFAIPFYSDVQKSLLEFNTQLN